MKEIAKNLNFSYDQRLKVAFGKVNGVNIAIRRDRSSGNFHLSFAATSGGEENLEMTLRSGCRFIISVSSVSTHTEIAIAAGSSDEESYQNINATISLLSARFLSKRQKNCCSICQNEEGDKEPYFIGGKVMFICGGCSRGVNGKPIYENPENVKKGILGALLFSLPFAVFFSLFNFFSYTHGSEASNHAFLIALGFPLAGITIYGYRKFSMTKEYLKSISVLVSAQNIKYKRMLSTKGILSIFAIAYSAVILTTVLTYALIINNTFSAGLFHSILMIGYVITEIPHILGVYQMLLPLFLLGTTASIGFLFYMDYISRGQSDGGHPM